MDTRTSHAIRQLHSESQSEGSTPIEQLALLTRYCHFSTLKVLTAQTAHIVLVEQQTRYTLAEKESGFMERHQIIQCMTKLSVLASLSLFAACASDSNKASGTGGASSTGGAPSSGGASNTGGAGFTCNVSDVGDASTGNPNCVTENAKICAADLIGFPFAKVAVSGSDCTTCSAGNQPAQETSATLTQPEPGMLCLSGRVSAGGWATLGLGLSTRSDDGKKILETFDAAMLGIAQVAVTIDSPPSQGLTLYAEMTNHFDCPNSATDCTYPPNFKYQDIKKPGAVLAPLADYKLDGDPGPAFDAGVLLDTSKLDNLLFQVNVAGDYNFCIHDFNLLDDLGNVVCPR